MTKSIDNFVSSDEHPSLDNVEQVVRSNPLFYETLDKIKDPKEKQEFLEAFNKYLINAYQNDPKLRRMLKSIDLEKTVKYIPDDSYDPRQELKEIQYSVPGRDYNYHNAMLGSEKKKKGLLKKIGENTADFGSSMINPALAGAAGAGYLKYWHKKQDALGAVGRFRKRAYGGLTSGVFKEKILEEGITEGLRKGAARRAARRATAKAGAEALSKTPITEGLFSLAGKVSTPLLYVTGGYFLYKTLKYFIKKRKERKETNRREEQRLKDLEDLKYQMYMQNQMHNNMVVG